MSLTIKNNTSSLIAQNSLKTSTNKLNQAIERMSSGAKINHAKDNAANYSIATNYSTKLSALQVAEDNVNMGLDMVTMAEEVLNKITASLSKVRELALQANNGTYGETSLNAISAEAEALLTNIEKVYKSAEYNGINLFYEEPEVDESKRIVNQTEFISGETYYIANSKDLVALQDIVNSGVDTTNINFELIKNINMSGINFRGIGVDKTNSFKGNFDGKGHIISNLTISTSEDYVGLFGYANRATIRNLGIENCDITGNDNVGGIVGLLNSGTFTGCYVKGNLKGNSYVGGVLGKSSYSMTIKNSYFSGTVTASGNNNGGFVGEIGGGTFANCYSEGNVYGNKITGGLCGSSVNGVVPKDCYSTCNVTGNNDVGGLIGNADFIQNCYSIGIVTGSRYVGGLTGGLWYPATDCACYINSAPQVSGGYSNSGGSSTIDMLTLEEISERYTPESMGFTAENGWEIVDGKLIFKWQKNSNFSTLEGQNEVNIQCGTNSENASSTGFNISFDLGDIGEILAELRNGDVLALIDDKLTMLENKATEYGTFQERLFGVLDEISIQYENLVSSRSTIMDADMAEVSSEYIRQQILQEASATLMATANQSPAIALQLI